MICENCKQREATVMYSENINGKKRELHVCSKCSKELGIDKINFNMPMSFSDFFGDMLGEFRNPELMPFFANQSTLKCKECNATFEDIINQGRFGCANCYETFEGEIDSIIKKMQGNNLHVGRIGKISDNKIKQDKEKVDSKEITKIDKLKQELKKAIKEERYEDAAKIRDEIQKEEKEK